jgi:hypothetical protein
MKKLLSLLVSALLLFTTLGAAMAVVNLHADAKAIYDFDATDTGRTYEKDKQGVDFADVKAYFDDQVNDHIFTRVVIRYNGDNIKADSTTAFDEYFATLTYGSKSLKFGSWYYDVNDAIDGADQYDLPDGIDHLYTGVRTENAVLLGKSFGKYDFSFWLTPDYCQDSEIVGDWSQITGVGYTAKAFNTHLYYFDKGELNDRHGFIYNLAWTKFKIVTPYFVYENEKDSDTATAVLGAVFHQGVWTARTEWDLKDDYLNDEGARFVGLIRCQINGFIYCQYEYKNYTATALSTVNSSMNINNIYQAACGDSNRILLGFQFK